MGRSTYARDMSEERQPAPDRSPARDERTGRSAAEARISNQTRWVDLQVQRAIERGEWDDLPGYGKPLELGSDHDPDWWVKKLVEREQITGVLPPALAIRKDDAELDDRLDRITTEQGVRREVEEFNQRVRKALYTPPTGPTAPPMVTRQRDVDAEVEHWQQRRTARQEAQRAALAEQQRRDSEDRRTRSRWPRRRR
jgi:hypothetical protein